MATICLAAIVWELKRDLFLYFVFRYQEEIKFLKEKHRKEKQSSGTVTAQQVIIYLNLFSVITVIFSY